MQKTFRAALITAVLFLGACSQGPPVIPPTVSTPTPAPAVSPSAAPSIPVPTVDIGPPSDPALAATDAFANRVAVAAESFIQTHLAPDSTRNLFSAPWGSECVATVQAILQAAAVPFVGPVNPDGSPIIQVDAFRNALAANATHWIRIDLGSPVQQAAPGDIWVQGDGYPGDHAGQNHVGICQDWGCAHVVSNSSQRGSFTWSDTPDNYAEYYYSQGFPYLPGAVYHHT